ncbi:hypothetical protein VTK56DRAFT_5029 [Thermocarpiscus australiensis]
MALHKSTSTSWNAGVLNLRCENTTQLQRVEDDMFTWHDGIGRLNPCRARVAQNLGKQSLPGAVKHHIDPQEPLEHRPGLGPSLQSQQARILPQDLGKPSRLCILEDRNARHNRRPEHQLKDPPPPLPLRTRRLQAGVPRTQDRLQPARERRHLPAETVKPDEQHLGVRQHAQPQQLVQGRRRGSVVRMTWRRQAQQPVRHRRRQAGRQLAGDDLCAARRGLVDERGERAQVGPDVEQAGVGPPWAPPLLERRPELGEPRGGSPVGDLGGPGDVLVPEEA